MDLIIGAGITGLTYANFTHNPYHIIEAESHTGGLCHTIYQDGFIWDYSGHFFHFKNSEIADYISKRLDKEGLVEVLKHTQIRYKDRMIDFPFQKNIHQLEQQEFIECLSDLFDTDSISPRTFKEMIYTKFGKSIAEKFLIPYNEKLYATDLNRLDADAMGRFFPYADKEEIIRNFRNKNDESYNGSFLYHKGGATQYVKALERDIPSDNISLNEQVIAVDLQQKMVTTNKRRIHYTHLISSIPLVSLLPMCGIEVDKTALSWNKVLVLNLGFDDLGPDTKNHWIYFPEKKYCFYRVGFYSNIIPNNRMSLYVEIGYPYDGKVDEQTMLQRSLEDLKEAGIVTNQNLVSYHSVVMNPAYVHISQEGLKEVARIKKLLAAYDVYTIGRYGSWNYSSIEDNMKEAIDLAQQIS